MFFMDEDGAPLVGGKLYTYDENSSLVTTYDSYVGDNQNTNPIILDSRGEASVWQVTGVSVLTLKTADDVEIWTAFIGPTVA